MDKQFELTKKKKKKNNNNNNNNHRVCRIFVQ
jgi:hypothetical protein